MEKRKITVISNEFQGPKIIQSDATTVAELKTDLKGAGINIEGQDLLEGISGTCLTKDAESLPQDLDYKGQKTNDLVIMMSTSNKRIKSGSFTSRKEVLEKAKDFMSKYPQFKERFGNITQVKSVTLLGLIAECSNEIKKKDTPKKVRVTATRKIVEVKDEPEVLLVHPDSFAIVTRALHRRGILSNRDMKDIHTLNDSLTSPYSAKELAEIKERLQ